jgi:hypothetical protein
MRSKVVDRMMKNMPLKTRLKVSIEMFLINFLTDAGFREDKFWGDDDDSLLKKICKHAEKMADSHMENIEEWRKDGEP